MPLKGPIFYNKMLHILVSLNNQGVFNVMGNVDYCTPNWYSMMRNFLVDLM